MTRLLFLGLAALLAGSSAFALEGPPLPRDLSLPPLSLAQEQTLARVGFPGPAWPHGDFAERGGITDEGLAKGAVQAASAATPGASSDERKRYLQGLKRLVAGDREEAAAAFAVLLDTYPGGVLACDASYWLAEISLRGGDWRSAGKHFEKAASPEGGCAHRAESLYSLGWMALRGEDYRTAADILRRAMEANPVPELVPFVLECLGESFFRTGDYGNSSAVWQRLADRFPEVSRRDRGLFRAGVSRYLARDYSQAAVAFQESAAQAPDDPLGAEAVFAAAWCRVILGQLPQAAELFRSVSERYPGSDRAEEAWYLAARALAESGRAEEALAMFGEQAGRFPEHRYRGGALFHAGLLLLGQGRFADAEDSLRGAAGAGGVPAALAWFMTGEAAAGSGHTEGAVTAYEAAAGAGDGLEPAAHALMKAGWCLYLAGEYESAASFFRRLTLNYPEVPFLTEALYWLAHSSSGAENNSLASFLFERVVAAGGERVREARYYLAWALRRQEKWPEAAAAFAAFAERHPEAPEVPEALYRKAECLSRTAPSPEAGAAWEELLRRYPGTAHREEALFEKGRLAADMERYGEAIDSLSALERDYPSTPYLARAAWYVARSHFKLADYPRAAAEFGRAIALEPGGKRVPQARLGQADAMYGAGQFGTAVGVYRQAADELAAAGSEGEAWARFRLADSLFRVEDAEGYRQAVARFRKDFRSSPLLPRVLLQAGDFEAGHGRPADAREAYRALLKEFPEHELAPAAVLRLARLLVEEGQAQEAAVLLEDASVRVREPAGPGEILAELGLTRRRMGDCRGALEVFDRAFASGRSMPNYPDMLYADARCAAEGGDRERSVRDLEELVRRYPGHSAVPEAALELAERKIDERAYADAMGLLKTAAMGPEETASTAQIRIGRLYRAMGEGERAVIEYLKIPYLFPERAELAYEARLAAAAIYVELGRQEEAGNILAPLAEDPAAGEFAARAREQLKKLGSE